MTEHPSKSQLELMRMKALPEAALTVVAKHLGQCSTCQHLFEHTVQQQMSSESLAFTLAPEFWLRHVHVSYEHLLAIAERTWDETEKESIDRHLTICSSCREDVSSFIAFREQVLPELDTSLPIKTETPHRSSRRRNWLSQWRFNPAYAAATLVLAVAVLIAVMLLLNRRSSNIAKQPPTPQISPAATPDSQASVLPRTIQSPSEQPNTELVITLNDRNGPITVDKNAKVTGLDAVSSDTRNDVAQVVLSERVDRPAILEELKGEDSALRGSSNQPFKLYSPARTIIVSNRPTFRWEQVAGATSYTVYVTDKAGQVVATSDELPSQRKQWEVPKPLKRGGVFSWTVTAVVQGREVVAPGPSAPEMKFKVLSTPQLQKLQQLKKTNSHLALGTFYADVGMVVEAEQEFQQLLRLNPNSEVASKLLRNVRSLGP